MLAGRCRTDRLLVPMFGVALSAARVPNMSSTSSVSVTLLGASFGDVGVNVRVWSWATTSEETEWESVTSLLCKVGHVTRGTIVTVIGTTGEVVL